METPELITPGEAAALMRVSRSKAYQLARSRTIPVVLIGHSIRIPRARLLDWIEARTCPGESA